MKLQFPKVPVQTSADFENEHFSLGDMRVIMNLLSSKIYSRPKYIIVQEVGSNARDANREANRPDTPITIKLPNNFDDNFVITDNGIGISPSRMSDVFLKYGNSTKRDTNAQTGGFGIGAKTPFTYTDSFTVVTVTDDDDGRHKRTYIAHKAEDMFRMSLVGTEKTTEDTGTAIGFAVQKGDFKDFEYAVKNVCQYWEPRPNIEGSANWSWSSEKQIHSGAGWSLSDGRHDAKVLIDRVPYSLRLDEIYKDRWCDQRRFLENVSIRLYFDTGEVDVSATREDLDYQPRTIQAIKDRVELTIKGLQDEVNKSISTAKSLWEASKLWQANRDAYRNFAMTPKWNGKDLFPNGINLPGYVYNSTAKIAGFGKDETIGVSSYLKITVFEEEDGNIVSKKVGWRGRTIDRTIHPGNNPLVLLDDSLKDRPNRLRLQTVFEKNPNVSEVAVVTLKEQVSLKVLKAAIPSWDDIPHELLTSYPKAKTIRAKSGAKRTINAVKKLTETYRSYKWTPVSDRAPEDTDGGVYILLKNGNPIDSSGKILSKDNMRSLARHIGETELFGILFKYRNKISSSWEELSAKATLKAGELRNSEAVDRYIEYGSDTLHYKIGAWVKKLLNDNAGSLKDQRIRDLLEIDNQIEEGREDYYRYQQIMHQMGQSPEGCKNGICEKLKELVKDYPMLTYWQSFDRHSRYYSSPNKTADAAKKELIFYLNAKFAAKSAGVNDAND